MPDPQLFENVIRSAQRWAFLTLGTLTESGDPWDVLLAADRIEDGARPAALVEFLTPPSPSGVIGTSIGRPTRMAGTVTVTAFPETGGGARESRRRAYAVADRLIAGALYGLVSDDRLTVLAPPAGLPYFDFTGVPTEGPHRGETGPALTVMDIDDMPVRPVPDPEDDTRWSVVLDLRLSFYAPGPGPRAGGTIVTGVPGTWVGQPPAHGPILGAPYVPPEPVEHPDYNGEGVIGT